MNDFNGCPIGEERYKEIHSKVLHKTIIQYDYRTLGGKLFSTLTDSLEKARIERDCWLRRNQ